MAAGGGAVHFRRRLQCTLRGGAFGAPGGIPAVRAVGLGPRLRGGRGPFGAALTGRSVGADNMLGLGGWIRPGWAGVRVGVRRSWWAVRSRVVRVWEAGMRRSGAEIMGLQYEAERLVRQGMARAEVSRRLGVHTQTLAQWALQGGWRKKDLDYARSTEATRKTILVIRGANEAAAERRALEAEVSRVLKLAVELLGEGSADSLERVRAMVEGMRQPVLLAPPRVELEPEVQPGDACSIGSASLEFEGVMEEEDWLAGGGA